MNYNFKPFLQPPGKSTKPSDSTQECPLNLSMSLLGCRQLRRGRGRRTKFKTEQEVFKSELRVFGSSHSEPDNSTWKSLVSGGTLRLFTQKKCKRIIINF